jgi:hypothetical protein
MRQRIGEANHRGTVAGGKYPHLCAMGEFLRGTQVEMKVVHINRPLEESIESLKRRSRKAKRGTWLNITDAQCEHVQRFLWARKQEYLGSTPHLTIEYQEMLDDPNRTITQLVKYLDIKPSAAQIQNAVRHVNPAYRSTSIHQYAVA